MTNEQLMTRCLVAAAGIVAHYRTLLPPLVVVLAGGGSKGKVDTKFKRAGNSTNQSSFNLPAELSGLVDKQVTEGAADSGPMLAKQQGFLSSLFDRASSPSTIPGYATLQQIMGLVPESFEGSSSLRTMAGRDPYSSNFEAKTEDAFRQRSSDALSMVQSGPNMVRGGQSRTPIAQGVLATRLGQERGKEVRDAQTQEAGIVSGAAQLLNLIETARRGQSMQAQGQLGGQSLGWAGAGAQGADAVTKSRASQSAMLELAARLLGSQTAATNDDLEGKGMQTSQQSNWSFLRGILG